MRDGEPHFGSIEQGVARADRRGHDLCRLNWRANVTPARLAWAKKHSTRSGNPIERPRNSSERTAGHVLKLRRRGWGLMRIGRELKIGTGTVQRILAERG